MILILSFQAARFFFLLKLFLAVIMSSFSELHKKQDEEEVVQKPEHEEHIQHLLDVNSEKMKLVHGPHSIGEAVASIMAMT